MNDAKRTTHLHRRPPAFVNCTTPHTLRWPHEIWYSPYRSPYFDPDGTPSTERSTLFLCHSAMRSVTPAAHRNNWTNIWLSVRNDDWSLLLRPVGWEIVWWCIAIDDRCYWCPPELLTCCSAQRRYQSTNGTMVGNDLDDERFAWLFIGTESTLCNLWTQNSCSDCVSVKVFRIQ